MKTSVFQWFSYRF